jgi:hypothetical protein
MGYFVFSHEEVQEKLKKAQQQPQRRINQKNW